MPRGAGIGRGLCLCGKVYGKEKYNCNYSEGNIF